MGVKVNKTPAQQSPMEKEVIDELDDLDLEEDAEGGYKIGGIYIPPPCEPYCSSDSKGPRLMIKKIENFNFKSYANKVEVGPFHQKFTAVIGPNGSGKSNVIDSMLFVFGCRANKIRASNLKSMIHNSSKYNNVESCKVAIHFQEILDTSDETYDVIENSDFVISRMTDRYGKSAYHLNGREVNFKQIADKLQHYGVDLKYNRFLILQGEVEKISLMKPKGETENAPGFLEYLEDIVGTTRYRKPLMQLSERVEKLNEEVMEKRNRCKLAEQEVKDLDGPKEKAVDYLKTENKLMYVRNLHFQKYVYEKRKMVSTLTQEKEVVDKEIAEHDAKFGEIKKQREEKESVIQAEIKKHEDLVHKNEEFKSMLGTAKASKDRVQATMKSTNTRRKTLKKNLEDDKKKLEDLNLLPAKNQAEITESEAQIEKLNKQKTEQEAELTKNLSKLEQDTKPLVDAKEPLEEQLTEIKATLDELKATYSCAEKELDIIRKDETSEKRKFESLKHSYEEQVGELQNKEAAFNEVQNTVPEIRGTLATKEQELKAKQQEEVEMSNELMKIKDKIDESRLNMQTGRSNNKIVNALMEQCKSGRIPGIFGRLGDLGGIDAKYDVAISTCCGRLDNIVTDTVDTATKCIDFLKTHNLGRATFIALEKVDYLKDHCYPIQTPENVPRLFDLVRVEDQRVIPAFYFALRNTLVGTDLDQGTRIAYGATRYRVVTLKGDVIEMTGTMSGGGRTQIRGKMGQKVAQKTANLNTSFSENELQSMQRNADKIQSRINDLQHQQGVLENEIKILKKNLQTKEHELKKLQYEIKSLTEQLPRLKLQLDKQEEKAENTKSDPVKVKQLEERVSKCKAEFEKKQEEVADKQQKVNELIARIKEIQDTKVKAVRLKVEKTTKQIDKLSTNINKLNVEISTSKRNIQKIEEKIKNTEQEITEAENNIRKMDEERTQFDKDITDLENKIEELTKQIEEANSGSSSIKKEVQALQKEENDGKMKRLEIEEKVKAVQAKIKEESKQIPMWENKLQTLKLNEIPFDLEPLAEFKLYTDEELEKRRSEDTHFEITALEEVLKEKPNLGVIEEYKEKLSVFQKYVEVLGEISSKRNEVRDGFDQVKKKRHEEFMNGFQIIARKLKEMYQMITNGGDAEISLIDSMDPFTEGISFSVRPPKKSWKVITNLSGGEKTLASLSLVFALHYYKPSPLYFLDEIDAALDFKNVSIIAHYINERTKNAQFIIISLRNNMFELSDYLTGIYKVEDCTHSITIKNPHKQQIGLNRSNHESQNRDDTLITAIIPRGLGIDETLTQPNLTQRTATSERVSIEDFLREPHKASEPVLQPIPMIEETPAQEQIPMTEERPAQEPQSQQNEEVLPEEEEPMDID